MTRQRDDAKVDQASKDSFPASDPPATSGITGPRIARKEYDPDAGAKDAPKDGRHGTAHSERDRRTK
jgi:hypothetical protein